MPGAKRWTTQFLVTNQVAEELGRKLEKSKDRAKINRYRMTEEFTSGQGVGECFVLSKIYHEGTS